MNMIGRLHTTASETSLYGAFSALYNQIIAFIYSIGAGRYTWVEATEVHIPQETLSILCNKHIVYQSVP